MKSKGNTTPFPIDAVYLWVDGNDPQWLAKKNEIIGKVYGTGDRLKHDAHAEGRFADNGELRYSLRSLSLYAPWIRNIYVVTDNQCPSWLHQDRVKIIDHQDIMPGFAARPCYSSRAIELCVHRIKDLAEHYLLLNDDVFFGSKVVFQDFFLPDGKPVIWVVKKRKKYKQKLLSGNFMHMSTYRGADTFGRRLILKRFNQYLPYRVRHYPKPMLRTVMEEIWNEFPDEVENTLSHHFRKGNDILIGSFFSFYMIAAKGTNPRSINGLRAIVDYFSKRVHHITATISDKKFHKKMAQIRHQRPLTFCINDNEFSLDRDRKIMQNFLSDLFPEKCIYER